MVKFTIRNVYGENKAYPANPLAQGFADVARTKTLTRETLTIILRMGFEVAEVDRFDNVSRVWRADTVQHLPAVY